jgi:hypothetical protein
VTLATGAAETVRVAGVLVFPSLDAVIDDVPGETPVATPEFELIVATAGLLDAKVTVRPVSTLPFPSFVTAENAGVVAPSTTDCDVGEIVMLATGAAVTVSVAAVLAFPSLVAVIDVVPAATPVATPVLELIVATVGSLELKTTVRRLSGLFDASRGGAVKVAGLPISTG